jgi:hypothetical protein
LPPSSGGYGNRFLIKGEPRAAALAAQGWRPAAAAASRQKLSTA